MSVCVVELHGGGLERVVAVCECHGFDGRELSDGKCVRVSGELAGVRVQRVSVCSALRYCARVLCRPLSASSTREGQVA